MRPSGRLLLVGDDAGAAQGPGAIHLTADALEQERVRRGVRARVFGVEAEPLALGRYTIADRIAEGGTSMVYLGRDEALHREVALKVMVADPAERDSLAERFLREGRTLARLDHPGTVRVFDVGEHDGLPYLVVELVKGDTLGAWRRRDTPTWREVLALMLPLGEALAAAHELGLIHRDVKPGNILRDQRGAARLVDFGFAQRVMTLDETSGAHLRSTLEGERTTTVGTPMYMAPEQWEGAPCDERTDQFSFCVTFYEALHGERPFERDARDPIGRRPPSHAVPAWIDELLDRGLRRDPTDRFDRLEDLLAALRDRQQSMEAYGDAEAAIARMAQEEELVARREQGLVAHRTLERAQSLWPDNPRVPRAREALATQRFDVALVAGDVEEAEVRLAELARDDWPAARARLEEAREQADAPARRLAALEHERDTGVEERFKAQTMLGSAVAWMMAYVLFAWLERSGTVDVTPWMLTIGYVLAVIGGLVGLRSLPKKYAANRVNRGITLVAIVVPAAHVLTTLSCAALGGDTAMALLFAHGQAATSYTIAALAFDKRAAYLTPTNVLGLLAIARWPEHALVISAIVVPAGTLPWAWSHHRAAVRAAS